MTIRLPVTTGGQVTFPKDVLQHLGVEPGEKIELNFLSDGQIALSAGRPSGSMTAFIGILAGRTAKVATIEEINEATALGWTDRK